MWYLLKKSLRGSTVIEVGNPFFRHHHEIHSREFMLAQTEAFTRQTFNPIAFMGASNVFLGDCKTDTGMPQRIQAAENGNLRRASPLWLLEDESEMTGS